MRAPPTPALWCALATLVGGTAALAQDGGSPVPAACGATLDEEGSCFGATAAWCTAPNGQGENPLAAVAEVDCAARGGACAELTGFGAWCVLDDGAACTWQDDDGLVQFACGDGSPGPGPGCDLLEGCANDAPPCGQPTEPKCEGDLLVLGCSAFGQALFVRCSGGCADARCPALPAGAPCDEDRLQCGPGLGCVAGRCERDDGGPAPGVDAGDLAPEPAPLCSHRRSGRGPGLGLALLGLPVLVVGGRRRR